MLAERCRQMTITKNMVKEEAASQKMIKGGNYENKKVMRLYDMERHGTLHIIKVGVQVSYIDRFEQPYMVRGLCTSYDGKIVEVEGGFSFVGMGTYVGMFLTGESCTCEEGFAEMFMGTFMQGPNG